MTQHLSEEQLILHYYGEGVETEARHLALCPDCRTSYQGLQRVLNSVDLPVPEPVAGYEQQVWNRLAPKLGQKRQWLFFAPRQWAAAAAMLAVVLAAFLAGRYSPRTDDAAKTIARTPVRERVLVVAVGDHLERSQMVLVELANAEPKSETDITDERALAETLLDANRLYRQTASSTGETGVVTVLEDLERVLIELVHSPGKLSAAQLEELRQRIDSQELLFKIRVVGSQLRERETKPASGKGSEHL